MENKDFYCGIDLSLSGTGLVHLDQDGTLIKQGLYKVCKPDGDSWQAGINRISDLVNRVYLAIPSVVRIICIEDLAANSKFMGSSIQLIKMRALFEAKLAKAFCLPSATDIYWIKPSSVKKFATGKGNASKIEVATSLTKRYGISFEDDNIADAYALCRMALAIDGYGDFTKAQADCLTIYTKS